MTRRVVEMTPTLLLSPRTKPYVTVLDKSKAEPPILNKPIRAAVHQWMTEINAVEELRAVQVEPRRSAILFGPPGCGKTTLAHHLAARLGFSLLCVHMDRLRSKWVGQTGEQIADLFDEVSAYADQTILFFDEFDAVAAKRSDDGQSSSREHNSIVDSLLSRIEGYDGIMIAATNRRESIDPAIWRRFGMHLDIDLPGEDERFAILKRYLQPYKLRDEDLAAFCAATDGAAPSLLRQLMEGIKRDLVLSARLEYQTDCKAVLERVVAAVTPHSDYKKPPLWNDQSMADRIHSIKWPPELERKAA